MRTWNQEDTEAGLGLARRRCFPSLAMGWREPIEDAKPDSLEKLIKAMKRRPTLTEMLGELEPECEQESFFLN